MSDFAIEQDFLDEKNIEGESLPPLVFDIPKVSVTQTQTPIQILPLPKEKITFIKRITTVSWFCSLWWLIVLITIYIISSKDKKVKRNETT